MFTISGFYKFKKINSLKKYKTYLENEISNTSIRGLIILSSEGINGTISGKDLKIESALAYIKSIQGFSQIDIKFSQSEVNPFVRLKIKLKKEIVTIGDKSINPNKIVGDYIDPKNWNNLISDKDTILIDTRNNYEYSIGTFKNSINPNTVKFREFPEWVKKQKFSDEEKQNKKIAMFCTGGIRCEKASSMMIKDGFKKVKHLKGGILNYFKKINEEESLWEGECFVFDDRVAIKHDLSEGSYDMCHGCRMPITEKDKSSELYIRGVACPSCYNQTSDEQKSRYMSRQKQVDLAKKRNQKHIGPKDEVQVKTK